MKEQQSIRRTLRLLLLSKALYYSVLWVIFLAIFIAIYTGYNFLFFPKLHVFRTIGILLGSGFIIYFILFPLRFLLSALLVSKVSLHYASRVLKKYDGGLTQQFTSLKSGSVLEQWSASKVLADLDKVLPLQVPKIKREWNLKKVVLSLILVALTLAFIPSRVYKESTLELVSGQLRPSVSNELNLPDSLLFNFGEKFRLNNYKSNSYIHNWNIETWRVDKDTTLVWSRQGRTIKSTYILCDSVSRLSDWTAEVVPPAYLQLNPYQATDTLKVYDESRVKFSLQGVLLDDARISVSRGTFSKDSWIEISDTSVNIVAVAAQFKIPVKIIKDEQPSITTVWNSRDSVMIVVEDDFGLTQAFIDNSNLSVSGTSRKITLYWQNEFYQISARDTKGQYSKRRIVRPKKTAKNILSEVRGETKPFELFQSKKMENEQTLSDRNKTLREIKKREEEKSEREKLLNEDKEQDNVKKERPEDLDKLLEKLDELWNIDQLAEVLDQMDSVANEALDSAAMELVNDLENSEEKAIKELTKEVKEIPSEGKERSNKAKELSKKLKELLADSQASVAEDNVERIKRLLKSSWMTSTLQEGIKLGSEVRDVQTQRNLMALEQHILDSLSLLIVSDPALAQALQSTQMELSTNLKSLREEFIQKGTASVSIGYVLNSLNELDKVLYFILESEKMSLMAAKKKCKNGQPGQNGKPSASGSGSKGKKGKKPGEGSDGKNGRKSGKVGGKRPSKSGEQGEAPGGKGKNDRIKEGLKRIDDAIRKSGGAGENKALERKLEQLKQELLFDSQRENFNLDDVERRLWEATKSSFEKEELGEDRKSNEGSDLSGEGGKEVLFRIEKSSESALPLPVLKKQNK